MFRLYIILTILFSISSAHVDDKVLYDFKNRCMICHDTYDKTDMAPPIVAVNRIYTEYSQNNLPEAKKAIISFLENPNEKKALMKPAVKIYGVMPLQLLTPQQRGDFADVILELDYGSPEWFEDHYKSHQLNFDDPSVEHPKDQDYHQ